MGLYDSTFATCPPCPLGHSAHSVEVQFKLYENHDPFCDTYRVGDRVGDSNFTGQLHGVFKCDGCQHHGAMTFGDCRLHFRNGVLKRVSGLRWETAKPKDGETGG